MNGERGGAVLLMLAVVAIVAAVGTAAASLGILYVAAEQASTAAEAAALAAAVASYPPASDSTPWSAASDMATANQATVESCTCPVDPSSRVRTVTVIAARPADVPIFGEIVVRRAASAEFDPVAWLGG